MNHLSCLIRPLIAQTAIVWLIGLPQPIVYAEDSPERPELIKLSFPGGTVGEYCDALRKAHEGVNVIVMPDAVDVPMPPAKLTATSFHAAIHLLDGQRHQDDSRLIVLHVGDNGGGWGVEGEQPVFTITAEVLRASRQSAAESAVWTVSDLLAEGIATEDVLTAVETSLEVLADGGVKAQLKFHEATGLIIASGTPAQLRAVEYVIDQLREGVSYKRDSEQRSHQGESKDDGELKELREAVEALTRAMAELSARMDKRDSK